VIIIAIAFLFGVVTTVYLSLRSPEVKVPDVVGKNRFDAEKVLADADLNFRVRAIRPSNQAQPDTVLFQLPRPGEVVKAGQTVAMDISRAAKEGEASETVKPAEEANSNSNSNSNSSGNSNENKPKKAKNKNANENANGNSNTNRNANGNANTNRNGNSNRPNANTGNTNTTPRANSNSNSNNRPGNTNQNANRRPATPKPTPTPNR
jgi:beta-lactam-binding protein with PASTA domain